MEGIKLGGLFARPVQNTLINSVRHAVVDEFGQHETVLALVEHFKGIRWEGQAMPDVRITTEDGIDVAGELGSLVLVNRVSGIGRRALDLDAPTAVAALGGMARCGSGGTADCSRALGSGAIGAEFGDQVDVVFQLDTARAVELNFLERRADSIVGLVFG